MQMLATIAVGAAIVVIVILTYEIFRAVVIQLK